MTGFMPRRITPAGVLALIALVAALAGTAYAAKKIGSKQLKAGAVTTKKLKNKSVTSPKLADRAVTTAKLADAAVTVEKVEPRLRSEGFETSKADQLALGAGVDTPVAALALPTNVQYVVTAATALGNNAATPNILSCQLRDDGSLVAEGFANLAPLAVFSQTITLTGVSNGGLVAMVCNPDSSASAKSRVITAVKVVSVQAP